MYEFIQGKIVYLSVEYTVIESNGIGYKILTPVNFFTSSPPLNKETKLFTSLVVRQDDIRLFGFGSRESRDLFETLTSISGIGPKTAIALIGHLTIEDFTHAIETDNIRCLSQVPGIGKKTAERIILELKDRIHRYVKIEKRPAGSPLGIVSDAKAALIHLGYQQAHAEKAIQKVLAQFESKPMPLSDLITTALKHL